MGKIKTRLVKRTAQDINKKDIQFSESFVKNKKILGNTMSSKKIRNQIAGFLARIKRREFEKEAEIQKQIKK